MPIQLAIDVPFVLLLMVVGAWLESIGTINWLLDKLLTPFPMGCFGLFVCGFELGFK